MDLLRVKARRGELRNMEGAIQRWGTDSTHQERRTRRNRVVRRTLVVLLQIPFAGGLEDAIDWRTRNPCAGRTCRRGLVQLGIGGKRHLLPAVCGVSAQRDLLL